MKIESRTHIKVKGLNQERVLNNIIKKVEIYNYNKEEHNISTFEVHFKDRKIIKKLLQEQGLEVVSISHKGILSKLKNLLYCYGIIIGLVVISLCYTLQYSCIWKFEVWGVEEKSEQANIIDFTKKSLESRFKFSIDTDEIEIKLKDNFEQISSVSVAIVGQSMIININEAILPNEMQGEFEPIKSDYDGIITKINLIQGTLNVKEGDIVRQGDILVFPYIIDSQGQERKVEPKAEIYADVWYSTQSKHYDYRIETKRTGQIITNSEVLLFGLSIYQNTHEIQFDKYEKEEYTQDLISNNLLPFKLKKTIYYEIEIIEINEPFDQKKDEIIQKAREKTLIFLQENEIIINESYSLKEDMGCWTINYVITTNKNIANR